MISIRFLTELLNWLSENTRKDQRVFPSVIILLILITFSLDYRLVPSRFSVCAVINGKDLVSSRCVKGRKEEFSLLPKRLCARQIAFPYSFAKINKWRLGTSLSLLCIDVVKRT